MGNLDHPQPIYDYTVGQHFTKYLVHDYAASSVFPENMGQPQTIEIVIIKVYQITEDLRYCRERNFTISDISEVKILVDESR